MKPLVLWAVAILAAEDLTWTFEADNAGSLPAAWSVAKTGEGPGSVWKVVAAERDGKKNQALAQTYVALKTPPKE